MIKTQFHSGRLGVAIGYGAGSIAAGTENVYLNQVFDVNKDNEWTTIRIPYNASTEFLRTYEGKARNKNDYSLGTASIYVVNPLKVSSDIVSSSISGMVFVKFENLKLYEPRHIPSIQWDTVDDVTYVSQGPVVPPDIIEKDDCPVDDDAVQTNQISLTSAVS